MISWSLKSCFALLSVLTCATFTLKSEWLEFPPLCPQINQATPSQIETSVQLTLRPVEHARCTLWACPRLVPNVCSWPHSLAAPTGLSLQVLALACEAARKNKVGSRRQENRAAGQASRLSICPLYWPPQSLPGTLKGN